jgi:uncharacterized protein (TIGR03435 family)
MAAGFAFGQGGAVQPGAAGGDTSADVVAFDVVSVRPAPGGKMTMGLHIMPDGIQAGAVTVRILVRYAYGGITELPTDDSVIGLPNWARSETFDVRAKMSEAQTAEFKKLGGHEQEQRLQAMLRALLADRFKLKVHREPKPMQDYELVVATGGPKFEEGGPKDGDGKPMDGNLIIPRGNGKYELSGFTMEDLANFLGLPVAGTGRIVKDKTGLTGKYNLALNFAPTERPFNSPSDDFAPSIFTALQEQLGLKLRPGTGTIHVVVVDHVEQPSEN